MDNIVNGAVSAAACEEIGSRPPLLFLCHRIPYPPNKGDKIRSFHLLRHLSRHFEIHLGSFVDDPEDWQWEQEVQKYCSSLLLRPLIPWQATLRSARGLLTGQALTIPYYADEKMSKWVTETVSTHRVGRAVVYSAAMAQFLPDHKLERTVVDFVDVDSDKFRQYSERKRLPMSWVYRREANRLFLFEQALAKQSEAALFVSAPEAELFRRLSPSTAEKTGFYNNGVDSLYFDPDSPELAKQNSPFTEQGVLPLVFTGAMDYWPNVDAVMWFTYEVLPMLLDSYPQLRFCIVGGNPAKEVLELAKLPGVQVTGRVPDVRPYLKAAVAAVAPMRIARGVQNKVLEGMAMAKPVLVSTKGLEGIDARNGEHILLADNAEQYRRGIRDILEGCYGELGYRARQLVQQDFSWEASLPAIVSLLNNNISDGVLAGDLGD